MFALEQNTHGGRRTSQVVRKISYLCYARLGSAVTRTIKTKIYTDGFEGWAKRAKARAEAMSEGRSFPPSRGITFESPAEMVRLLTPSRLDLFEKVKKRTVSIKDLAAALGRDVSAVRRDVVALEKFGIVASRQVVNPGHGRVRVVSAPASISISAEL